MYVSRILNGRNPTLVCLIELCIKSSMISTSYFHEKRSTQRWLNRLFFHSGGFNPRTIGANARDGPTQDGRQTNVYTTLNTHGGAYVQCPFKTTSFKINSTSTIICTVYLAWNWNSSVVINIADRTHSPAFFRYYIPPIDEFIGAEKGISIWCKS